MDIKITAGASALALLALTACGQSEGDKFLEGMGCDPSESADECGERKADEMMEDAPTATSGATGQETGGGGRASEVEPTHEYSDDPILGEREFTGRMDGDVQAVVGEPVDIDMGAFENIGDYMGTLTIDELVAGPECESATGEVLAPQHGHWLFATVTLSADGDAEDEFSVSASDFRWAGLDAHIGTSGAFECQDFLNGLQDPVRPGESAERVLVFDIPEFEGTLVYRGATHYVEWEIERADYANAERLPE